MENVYRIDHRFDLIVFNEVFPSIAKAFCYLNFDIDTGNKDLSLEEVRKQILEEKAKQLKLEISRFIDEQARVQKNLFT